MKGTAASQLMTVKELAQVLNVQPSWVYAKVASGDIPHLHVGRYPRFLLAEVIEWLKARSGRGASA